MLNKAVGLVKIRLPCLVFNKILWENQGFKLRPDRHFGAARPAISKRPSNAVAAPNTEESIGIRYSSLKIERDAAFATIKLSGTSPGNRIDAAMAGELREVCRALNEDDELRLVLLTANGPAFSTGRAAFAPETSGGQAGTDSADARSWLDDLRVSGAVASVPVPVLVALNGDATGHGLELALAGDLRIAVSGAKLGFSPLTATNFPWDGGTQRLPRLVGPVWARDMLLTGRMLTAAEALSIGLVNRVVETDADLEKAARELADQVLAGSPLGARYAKEAVYSGMDLTLEQGLRLEADLNVILQSTSDRAEGIQSFLDRRPPRFGGR